MTSHMFTNFTEEVKDRLITFRVTDEEWNKVNECARRAGVSCHEWCREMSVSMSNKEYGLTANRRMVFEEYGVIERLIGTFIKKKWPDEMDALRKDIDHTYKNAGQQLIEKRKIGKQKKGRIKTGRDIKRWVIAFRVTISEGQRIDECSLREGLAANEWCKKVSVSDTITDDWLMPYELMEIEELGVIEKLLLVILNKALLPSEMKTVIYEITNNYEDYGNLLFERRKVGKTTN